MTYFVADFTNWDEEIQAVRDEVKVLSGGTTTADLLDDEYIKQRISEALTSLDINELTSQIRKQKASQVARSLVAENMDPPKDWDEYTLDMLDQMPPPTPLLGDVLGQSTLAILLGKFGTFKSFLAIDWAACLASGRPWDGQTVARPIKVMYVAAEGHVGMRKRLAAWQTRYQRIPAKNFVLVPESINLGSQKDVDKLTDRIKQHGCQLLVLDTLHKCCPGIEENSATEMGAVLGRLDKLRDATGCTVLMVHHTGHAGTRARGSSSLEDDVDTSWLITLNDDEKRGPEDCRILSHRKSKDGEFLADRSLMLELIPGTDSGVLAPCQITPATVEDRLDVVALVAEKAQQMDDAGERENMGWEKTWNWFKDRGDHSVTQSLAKQIVKVRKPL